LKGSYGAFAILVVNFQIHKAVDTLHFIICTELDTRTLYLHMYCRTAASEEISGRKPQTMLQGANITVSNAPYKKSPK
jgi:hypothetical protein